MAELSHTFTTTFNNNYMINPEVTEAIDQMQMEYHCCGALTFSQWRDSLWLHDNPDLNNSVPDSCCKTPSPYCGVRDHPSNIWYNGCIHQFEDELGRHLLILGAVGCGICLIQVFGMILSCCLYIKLKDIDENYY
ncbi:CD151 antigen-like [Homarus americanus]|uniref:CD151 antigen-like n=2 Tax=Homarus americanus TaxID=6706 RepID=A0A8J5MMK6_HOMAM|nr:CD151 antigen-like [Homarus americanus]